MKPKSTLRPLLALTGSSLLAISSAQAQTFTWDGGGGDDNFGTAANWVGDALPGTGSGVILYFTGGTRTAPVNNYATGDNFGEWRLTGAPSAFTITGNGFGLFGKIENSSTNSQLFTINTAGIYARDSSIEINPVGGSITIGSSTSITLDNNATLNVYNGGSGNTLTINGTLSKGNNTGGAGQIILWQTSNVILTGTNDYGGTTLNTGTTLRIGDGGTTGTLGIGNVTNTGGSLFFNRSNDLTVTNLITGTGSVTKQGAGVLTLSNTNTYTGITTLSAGTLSVGSIGNGSVAGNLGQASNAAANLVFDGGTLRYTGSTATSDRAFTINAGKTATINVVTDSLSLAGLSLAGATGAATTGALTKTGNGTFTLTGANTYTGATTVNLGRLALGNGGNLGATAVAVNARGTFAVAQNASSTANAITGSISLNSGATFTMADTFTSTLNVTGASALAPASGTGVISPLLVFDIIGSARDTLAIAGVATVGTAGAKISIAPSTTNVTPGSYTVISGAALSNLNANLSLVSGFLPNSGGLYTLSLGSSTTTAAIVTVAADANALYWKGAGTAWNTAGNWTTNQAGTIISGAAPTSTTNVAFSAATPGNLTTNTLTAPLTVNSVNFLAAASAVTVGTTGDNTANPLTINGGGITNGSANAMIINNPVTLGAAQTWTNTGAGTLTIGGDITNGANLLTVAGTGNTTISGVLGSGIGGLTMSGTGTLTLSVANSYSGGTTISSGTIDVRNSSALGSGSVSVASGAVLFIGNNGNTVANDIALNGMSAEGAINNNAPSGGNVTNLTGKITLNTTSNITTHWKDKTLQLSGKITGAGGLNFDLNLRSGAIGGRYYITGATNDYMGATAITGTASPSFGWTGQAMLYLGATNALPTTSALTLNYADLYLNGQSQTLPSISGSGSFSVQNGSTTAATLTLGSGDTTSTFSGTIQDNGISVTNTSATPATVTGTVALTKIGNGTLTLTNTNTYTGATTVNAGTLTLGHATDTLSGSSAVTVDGATAILSIGANSDTVGAVSLKNAGSITGSGGTLTGASYAVESGSVSAKLGGAGIALTKTTGGTVTLTGTNTYTGATTVNAGTLSLGHATDTLSSSSAVTVDGATAILSIGANSDTVGAVSLKNAGSITGSGGTLTGASYAVESGSVSAKLGGAGIALTKSTAGTVTLTGANTYTGATTVNAGTLSLGHATDTLSSSSAVTVDGATAILSIGANSDTVGAVSLKNGGSITGSGGTLTGASYAVESGSVSAILGGASIALTKSTAGTVTLTGVNTYTGATALNAGTLIVGVAGVGSTAAGSAVSVGASGTLGGSGTINGTLAVTGTLAPGNSGIGTLNAGATTWNSGSVWNFDLSSANTTSDKLAITGALTKATPGGTYQFNFMNSSTGAWGKTYELATFTSTNFLLSDFSFTGLGGSYTNGTFAITGTNLTFTAIPEPTSALAGLLLGAGLLRRRRSA